MDYDIVYSSSDWSENDYDHQLMSSDNRRISEIYRFGDYHVAVVKDINHTLLMDYNLETGNYSKIISNLSRSEVEEIVASMQLIRMNVWK